MTGTIRNFIFPSAAIAVLLALTGCASAPIPKPDTTPSAATSTPTPFSSSTADPVGPELSSRPEARVPLGCDELMGEGELALAMSGVPVDSISVHPSSANSGTIATLQGGMLACFWQTLADADPQIGRWNIRLEILPDAAEAYQADAAAFPPNENDQALIGPNSSVSCFDDGPSRSCEVSFENDGYWVELNYSGLAAAHPARTELLADAVEIGTSIRDDLSAAGPPRPAFSPAADAPAPVGSCLQIDADGAFRGGLGTPSLIAPVTDQIGTAMVGVAMERAGRVICTWRQTDVYATPAGELRQIRIEMIPGAGWAWPELLEIALATDADAQVTVPGADAAVVVCRSVDDCTVQALVGGSYLSIDAWNEEGNTADARAGALKAAELAISTL
ncbi:hypothetical protein GCM10022381_05560 [Leifsonia kafniensis]|uniref:DUF3558 domain-containing protein n=1 Tax=Leifsonia kafniensis TaxID=475957 RepID=A0ABP7K4X5_9MICO